MKDWVNLVPSVVSGLQPVRVETYWKYCISCLPWEGAVIGNRHIFISFSFYTSVKVCLSESLSKLYSDINVIRIGRKENPKTDQSGLSLVRRAERRYQCCVINSHTARSLSYLGWHESCPSGRNCTSIWGWRQTCRHRPELGLGEKTRN